jgi:Cof subfamily protein (haloacid dehalogenase superfamily)
MSEAEKPPQYRLVVCDLDGTLVGENLRMKAEDLDCIREVRRREIEITLATGRTFESALPYVQELGIELPVILCNGAAIVHPVSGEILYQQKLPKEPVLKILKKAWEADLDCLLYTDPFSSCPSVSQLTPVLADFILLEGLHCVELNDLATVVRDDSPIKIQIVGEEPGLLELQRFFRGVAPEISLVLTQRDYLEAMPVGVSKGTALQKLSEYAEIPLSRMVAFGDSTNDEELIALAGFGVAMADAPEKVRKAAKTTASGVAAALTEIFGLTTNS